jgi:signal transduction histidine kinase
MVAVVALVVTIFMIDAGHDRKLVFDSFVEERLGSTAELAGDLAARLAAVRKDVLFFKYLVQKSALPEVTPAYFRTEEGRRFRREVASLLNAIPHYKEMRLVAPDGSTALRVGIRGWDPGADREAIERYLGDEAKMGPSREKGRVRISPPIPRTTPSGAAPGYRSFTASVRLGTAGRRGAVLLLLEPAYLFTPLRAFRAEDSPRFALVNRRLGRVAYSSMAALEEPLKSELADPVQPGSLGATLRSREEPGRMELSGDVARRLGLGSEAVVTYAPLPGLEEWQWTLVCFSTTELLEARDAAVLLRTAAAMLAVLAGLGTLGALLLRQVRRETELRESLRVAGEIRHLHELSQKILDNIPSGLLALSAQLRVLQANRAIQARTPRAVSGAALGEVFPAAAPGEVERLTRLVEDAIARREIASLDLERVALFEARPGSYHLLAVPIESPLTGAGALLMVEDRSELKRLQQELVLAGKLSTIGILSAGIAHEIGTPLGVIRARAEHLLEKAPDEAASRSLQAIVDQSDAISRIVRSVLGFARTRKVETQPTPVGPVCRDAAELLRERFAKRRVSLTLTVPRDLPPALADADGIRQVLVNLLQNALDACQPGQSVAVRGTLEEHHHQNFVRLDVRDTGAGIPREQLASVFDPFFTTKKGGEGSGLGLAIVQDIVKNHGGTLSVESDVGQGSCFTILWPVAEAKEEKRT